MPSFIDSYRLRQRQSAPRRVRFIPNLRTGYIHSHGILVVGLYRIVFTPQLRRYVVLNTARKREYHQKESFRPLFRPYRACPRRSPVGAGGARPPFRSCLSPRKRGVSCAGDVTFCCHPTEVLRPVSVPPSYAPATLRHAGTWM